MNEAAVSSDGIFWITILCMIAVTYSMRAGGFWIMGRVTITPRVRRGLEALPGAIIVATVFPIILQGGASVFLALLVALGARLVIGKDYIAVFCAVGAAAAIRALGIS